MHPFQKKVEDMLARFGGFYVLEDILHLIQIGEMQSFVHGDSWAVTQICEFPQRRAVDIVFVVGEEKDLDALDAKITEFAKEQGIDRMMTNGRLGFTKRENKGWKMFTATFIKELNDGP